jgi:HD superfamily phosphohydrolase
MNEKSKIINDPLYGLLNLPDGYLFEIIQHPYFQRLRRINQLGLSSLIYPGATHTRFQHTLGAVHLLRKALNILKSKHVDISPEEEEAVTLTVLLHDIGHGPFSHTLEKTIIHESDHEKISLMFMDYFEVLNPQSVQLAKQIFQNTYPKKFLHELVSSQLDVDRMDYLLRDSFYTGVSEGIIGYDRIIQMLDVHDNHLVVEEKGIYSVEKFIISRRLMYWQVYLHKTAVCAEKVLQSTIERAKNQLSKFTSDEDNFTFFLLNKISLKDLESDRKLLDRFGRLDDYDVIYNLKKWIQSEDKILSFLAKSLIDRNLFKIEYLEEQHIEGKVKSLKNTILKHNDISEEDVKHLILLGKSSDKAYNNTQDVIKIKMKNGDVYPIEKLSHHIDLQSLSKPILKHYICYPKDLINIF